MDGDDFFGADALADELTPDGLAVDDDRVREAERLTLDDGLRAGSHAAGLALGGDARGRARNRGCGHAEDVRVEVVRVQNVNLVLAQVGREASELSQGVEVVKARQRKCRRLAESGASNVFEQNAARVERGHADAGQPRLAEQARQLHGLTLRAALLEAVREL